MDHRGTHLILDLYGCRKEPNDGAEAALRSIARLAGLDVVGVAHHRFDGGGGETAILLLSQSHCSVHTWPEKGYAAFDLYSCRTMAPGMVESIADALRDMLKADHAVARIVRRGNAVVPEKV